MLTSTKFNPAELVQLQKAKSQGRWARLTSDMKWWTNLVFRKDWKHQQYGRGKLVNKDVSDFFPES